MNDLQKPPEEEGLHPTPDPAGTYFRRTALGLWVPAEPETPSTVTDLPLLIAEQIDPDRGTLLLAAPRAAPSEGKAFFTEDEIDSSLGLTPLSRHEVIEMLGDLPSEATITVIAGLLNRLSEIGYRVRDQLSMAAEIYGDAPVLTDMAKFCAANDDHVIFSEQGFFSLLAHAVVHCAPHPPTELTENQGMRIKRLLLAAPSLLHQDGELGEFDPSHPEEWLAYMFQNLLFNAHANFGSGLARTWRIVNDIGFDSSREWKSPTDLSTLIRAETLSLDQQFGLAFGLHALLQRDGAILISPDHWREMSERTAPDLDPDDVISQIAATPTQMREELAGKEALRLDPLLRWATIPFLERPFLRLSDDRLLLVSPRALESWPTDGIHYRLLAQAINADPMTGAQHYTALIGELTETYVVDLLEREVSRLQQQHIGVGTFEVAQPLPDGESIDVFLRSGKDLVVLEISSSRVTAPTRLSGSTDSLTRDIEKVVTKRVRQLDRTISAFESGGLTIAEASWDQIDRIFPVVVNVEPIRWTSPLHAYLVREVPDLLQQDKTEPLQFVDIEDLEALISVVGPRTLADLLAAKIRSVGTDPDVQQWFHTDPLAPKPDRPLVVQGHLDQAFDAVLASLGFRADKAGGDAREA